MPHGGTCPEVTQSSIWRLWVSLGAPPTGSAPALCSSVSLHSGLTCAKGEGAVCFLIRPFHGVQVEAVVTGVLLLSSENVPCPHTQKLSLTLATWSPHLP